MNGTWNKWAEVATAAVLTGGCESDLTSEHARQIESTGAVEGSVYLDVDGNGTRGGPDEPYPDLGIQLVGANGGVVAEAKTDEAGEFRMGLVPVGNYKLEVDPSTLSGGLAVFGLEEVSSVALGTQGTDNNLVTVYSVEFRVSFPVYSLSEVKDLPPGRPVTTQGFALNSRPNFGDGVVHFQEGDVYLRAINVARANISPGDSVRIVGKTSIDQGLPILEDVSVVRLVSQAVLLDPVELSTADAASADGGLLDAALIRIQNATITDTEPAPGGGLIVTADDGSGPVDLLMRSYLQIDPSPFVPNASRFVSAVGLLVPHATGGGQIRWRMTPRAQNDLSVEEIEFPPPTP